MVKMKFRVHSKEHCKAIQKRLFELGYKWAIEPKKKYSRLDSKFLYTVGRKFIGSGDCEDDFNDDYGIETTLDDLYENENENQYPEEGTLCLVWDEIHVSKYFAIYVGDGRFADHVEDNVWGSRTYENYEVITDLDQFKNK